MKRKPLLVIPARLEAVRLPNKPLADIHGKPMVVRVWERACQVGYEDVIVACSDEKIAQVVALAGGRAVLTDPSLPSGTDRVYAAWQSLPNKHDYDAIVNIQGDLPTLEPALVRETVETLYDTPEADVTTPVSVIEDRSELSTPSVVKVASGTWNANKAKALYFSRSCIPHGAQQYYHHIGVYSYRPEALEAYVSLDQTRLEKEEKLEQLRGLENGMSFYVVCVDTATPFGVDTEADLEKARYILGK